ncbi:MAG: TIGR04076 family protein [Candidatus Heimdallarchaeota archaeon]|nr:TIGR04076 family protein [Candidatus Heimdallarchaeota archaeon]
MNHPKLKFTVINKFSTKDITGSEVTTNSGYSIPTCPFFDIGDEHIAENSFTKPEKFCGWAWKDLSTRLTKFELVEDMDWPDKNTTYMACGDGLRPVIFKVEKLT